MASSLPSPPASPVPMSTSKADSSTRLDILLESYLNLLDTYTTLRTQLSQDLSAGFLSLAHANRNAATVLGAGRRFGQDGYDRKMKACRGVRIERGSRRSAQIIVEGKQANAAVQEEEKTDDAGETQAQNPESNNTSNQSQSTQQSSPESENQPAISSQHSSTHPSTSHSDPDPIPVTKSKNTSISELFTFAFHPESLPNPSPPDPLSLFTALPPPSLRQTQSHFSSALSTSVPQLLTVQSELSAAEGEIWALRREMGVLDEYEYVYDFDTGVESQTKKTDGHQIERINGGTSAVLDNKVVEAESIRARKEKQTGEDADLTGKGPKEQPSSSGASSILPSPSRKQNLVSRTQPRSRVLKLD